MRDKPTERYTPACLSRTSALPQKSGESAQAVSLWDRTNQTRDNLPTTATAPSRAIPDTRQESAAVPSRHLSNPVIPTSSIDGMPFANNGHVLPVGGWPMTRHHRD
ncbi:hypothetical protein GCM10027021_01310 [Dyella kyungheensis]